MENENMFAWRARRRVLIIIGLFIIITIPALSVWYLKKPEANCFDKIKNQNEIGVDCGGSCEAVCSEEVADLLVLWSRAFSAGRGEYYLAALLENPNPDFAVSSFNYTFRAYSKENTLVVERRGSSFANPREAFMIFEPKFPSIGAEPVRASLIIENVEWERSDNYEPPQILVKEEALRANEAPRLSATITNDSLRDLPRSEVAAIIYDEEDNAIAASLTVTDPLIQNVPQTVTFTWQETFPEAPRVCVNPIRAALAIDRSGSMNDDGENPPQPLTDAKDAAKIFVNQMSSRDKVGIVSFATRASSPPDQEITGDFSLVKRKIDNIVVAPEEERGFTNLGEGIDRATAALSASGIGDKDEAVMVILTDGRANAPTPPGGEIYAREKAFLAKSLGYTLYTIGLGDNVNQSFLRSIATSPANYFFSATSAQLGEIYKTIAQDICPERVYLTRIFVRPEKSGR